LAGATRALRGLQTSPVSWLGGKSALPNSRVTRPLPSHRDAPKSETRQWMRASESALQSRGGDGFAPSSRARGLRWLWRGGAHCGLKNRWKRNHRV